MLALSGLAPLVLGIVVMLTLLIPERWKLGKTRGNRESPWAFGAVFGVVPTVFGLVRSFTGEFTVAIRWAMGAGLLAAAAVAVEAVVRRRLRGLLDTAIITALVLPLGLAFGAVFQQIERPARASAAPKPVKPVPCTARVTKSAKTGKKVQGRLVFAVTVMVKIEGRPEQRHKLIEELYRSQYERLGVRKTRYECLARLDVKYVEVLWDKRVSASAKPSAAAVTPR